MFSKMLLIVMLAVTVATVLSLPIIAFAADDGGLDAAGESVITGLKSLASGKLGKAIFAACMFAGVVTIISPRHRGLGIAALVTGVLLGVYGGLLDSVWTLFGGK